MSSSLVISSIILAGIILLSLIWANIWLRLRPNAYHRRMRRQARKALKKLKQTAESRPGAVISYLRKMNPHAVEEIILDAAEAAGHKTRRNSAYTGDGGVDGEICISGTWCLVQTKRYSSAINPRHVTEFSSLCARRSQPGLFIHCGRTGNKSREAMAPHIRIISGSALVDLIKGQPLKQFSARPEA